MVSNMLNAAGIEHQVLNAKHHEREAQTVAEASRPGGHDRHQHGRSRHRYRARRQCRRCRTGQLGEEATEEAIAEYRAGWQKRHEQVLAAGGLRVIGTERHESRRIDNQLRGRPAARATRFITLHLSLEDSLMRIFARSGCPA